MHVLAMFPLVMFGLVGLAVAIKLMLLAFKTRQLPEFSISMSLIAMNVIGVPLARVGRMPGNFGTPDGDMIFAAGILSVNVGIWLTYLTTWSVFRRGRKWAFALVAAAAIALLTDWVLIINNALGSTDMKVAQAMIRPYAVTLIAIMVLGSVWGGFESLRYWGMQKKRLRIGLAEPVVVERFLWWGVANFASVVLGSTLIASLLMGKLIMLDPVSLAVMGIMGSVLTISWAVSFFPPKAYVNWVEARASAAS